MPVHGQLKRFQRGFSKGCKLKVHPMPESSNTSACSGSSHATISEDSAGGGLHCGGVSFPVGTKIKKYFNGHGWCAGKIVSISSGQCTVHFENRSDSVVPLKDRSYPASQLSRLTKTAQVQPGSRLEIYWPQAKRFYRATVKTERPRKRENFLLSYDGEKNMAEREWIDLHRHKFRIIENPKQDDRKPSKVTVSSHPNEVVVVQHQDNLGSRHSPLLDPAAQLGEDTRESLIKQEHTETIPSSKSAGIAHLTSASTSGLVQDCVKVESSNRKLSAEAKIKAEPSNDWHLRHIGDPGPKATPRVSNELMMKRTGPVQRDSATTKDHSPVTLETPAEFDAAATSDDHSAQAHERHCDQGTEYTRIVSMGSAESSKSENLSLGRCTPPLRSSPTTVKSEPPSPLDSATNVETVDQLKEALGDSGEDGVTINPLSDPGTRSVVCALIEVGSRVSVFWEEDQQFYPGTVTDCRKRGKPFYLEYDDGEEEWIDLRKHVFRLLSDVASTPSGDGRGRSSRRLSKTEETTAESQKTRRADLVHETAFERLGDENDVLGDLCDTPSREVTSRRKVVTGNQRNLFVKTLGGKGCVSSQNDDTTTNLTQRKKTLDELSAKSRKKRSLSQKQKGNSVDVADVSTEDISNICVGSRVAVWWDGDAKYYSGEVIRQRKRKKPFLFVYDDDDAEEWIDFTDHKFKLLSISSKEKLRCERTKKLKSSHPENLKKIKVGSRVAVWWTTVSQYFEGTVIKQREHEKPFFVEYDRGKGHWLDFSKHKIRVLDNKTKPESKKAKKRQRDTPAAETDESDPDGDKNLDVVSRITIGARVSVYWEGDSKYYEGTVTKERKNGSMRHYIEYTDGEAAHWIDFREHWIQLLSESTNNTGTGISKLSAIKQKKRKLTTKKDDHKTSQQSGRSRPKKGGVEDSGLLKSDSDDVKVGSRVEIWWAGDKEYYKASVVRACSRKSLFFVKYDDDETEWIDFEENVFRVLPDETAKELTDTEETARSADALSVASQDHLDYDDFFLGAVDKVDIGSRLSVWWPSEKRYFDGTLTKMDFGSRKSYFMEYDDGDEEWTDLSRRYFRLID